MEMTNMKSGIQPDYLGWGQDVSVGECGGPRGGGGEGDDAHNSCLLLLNHIALRVC